MGASALTLDAKNIQTAIAVTDKDVSMCENGTSIVNTVTYD